MHRTVKAALAAAGVLLLCGTVLAQEVRIPRKGSSPGFLRPPAQDTSRGWFDDTSSRWWREEEEDDNEFELTSKDEKDGKYGKDGSDDCRKRTAAPPPDVDTQNVVVSYMIGGVLGALIASSTGDEVRKHVGDASRRLEHADCMARRRSGKSGRGGGDD